MANVFVVKTQFKGADRLTPILKKIGINVERTGNKATKSFRRATKAAGIFGGVLKGNLVAGAISRGVMAANNAIRGLSQEFIDFDKNITKAIVRLPGRLDRSSKAFQEFGDIARREAKRTEFTAGEAAAAVEQLALAGFDLEKVTATLPGVLNLATNADVGLADATKMAVKTMGAFSLKGGDAADTARQLTRVNNVFSKSISSATINMEDLFEAIKFGGPAADSAGVKLEEFVAVTQILADASIDASVAGTSMRTMFTSLAKLSPKATKELKKMGVAVKDRRIEFKDFAEVIGKIETATAKMSKQQRLGALKVIFGKTAVNAATKIIAKGADGVREYTKNISGLTNESERMAKIIRNSVEGRIKRVKSALVDLGFKFIKAFNIDGGKAIESLINDINRFDVKPVTKALNDIITMIKDMTSFMSDHRTEIKLAAGAWIGYKAGLKAIMAMEAAAFFMEVAKGLAAGKVAATGAAAAMTKLATFTAPVLGVFAALGAVVAIVFTDFENVTLGLAEGMARLERSILKMSISAVGAFKSIVNAMRPVLEAVGMGGAIDFGFGIADQLTEGYTKRIKALDVAIKDMEIASLSKNLQEQGIGVVGDQNVRGLGLSRQTAADRLAQVKSTGQFKAAQFNPFASRLNQPPRAPQAPNRSEVEAKQQSMRGTIEFKGAPSGTTFRPKKGPGLIPLTSEGLGANG